MKLRSVFAVLLLISVVMTGCFGGGTSTYSVSGTVTDENGDPLSGALVVIGNRETETNDEGNYVVTRVPEGEAVIKVSLAGYAQGELTINIDGNVVDADLSLNSDIPNYFTVSGEVAEADTQTPLSGASVNIDDEGYWFYAELGTNAPPINLEALTVQDSDGVIEDGATVTNVKLLKG